MSKPHRTVAAPVVSEKKELILDAVLTVLAREGIAGVSMRAVSREAGVALGLMNYYFDDKTSLIAAALRRIGEQDALLVQPTPGLDPQAQLLHALRVVAKKEFLDHSYLGLRLQLWSLAAVDPVFRQVNNLAQSEYLRLLSNLIAAAFPKLAEDDVAQRASDVLVIQNGVWLTSILITDSAAVERSIERCVAIAFGDS